MVVGWDAWLHDSSRARALDSVLIHPAVDRARRGEPVQLAAVADVADFAEGEEAGVGA